MILYQAGHGALDNGLNGVCHEVFGNGTEVFAEMPGNAADESYGEFWTAVGMDVEIEEVLEGATYEEVDGTLIGAHFGSAHQVLADEGTKGGEEAIGSGLAIDAVDDLLVGEMVLLEELFAELVGKLALEEMLQEDTTEIGAAAFITEDIAERGDVVDDVLAVVNAGVAAGAHDTGDTRLTAEKCACGSEHIALHVDFGFRELFGENLLHLILIGRDAAGTIEKDLEIFFRMKDEG